MQCTRIVGSININLCPKHFSFSCGKFELESKNIFEEIFTTTAKFQCSICDKHCGNRKYIAVHKHVRQCLNYQVLGKLVGKSMQNLK